MKILDRYIGTQVLLTISVVTIALLGVDVFFYLVNELRTIGRGDYTFFIAVQYILLTVPRKLYTIFPWATLLGALLALGNLGKYSELVAMRVATISVPRIAWAAMKAGLILMLAMFICGELVAPHTESWARNKKILALSGGQVMRTQSGTWVRHNNEFIHVGLVDDQKQLNFITRYDFDDDMHLHSIEYAGKAQKNSDHWDLQNIQGTKFNADGVVVENALTKQTQELLDPEVLQTSQVKHLECLTITKLWRVIKSRIAQELNATEYERAFWMKLTQPFAVLVMVFLAVPFAFGSLRSSSMGLKILVGVLFGFSFHTLNSIFGPLTTVVGLSPMIAAMIPAMVFLVLGSVLVMRVR